MKIEQRHYDTLPEYMQDGMRRYMERGIMPGQFLTAVLENDLMEAFGRADDVNIARMRDYVIFLYNYASSESYGSKEAVKAWCEKHRKAAENV